MVVALLLSAALLVGVPPAVVALLVLGLAQPLLGVGALIAFAAVLERRVRAPEADATSEAVYHAAVAAELRRGASLRIALAEAAARTPELGLETFVANLVAGRPVPDVSASMAPRFRATGRLLRPAVVVAQDAGGQAAHVFERLAGLARNHAETAREQKAATAQVRLSAWIVAGLPIGAVVFAAASGRLGALVAVGPLGIGVLGVGATLLTAGLVLVAAIVRRSV
ncbi:MAG TPA: hypothetical protein VLG28_00490 [Acidimicrobiia bacterium]|nr:hypothetical protein [Acidimicrobiia bacterium]